MSRFRSRSSSRIDVMLIASGLMLAATACVGEVSDLKSEDETPVVEGPAETGGITRLKHVANPIANQYIVVMRDDVAFASGLDIAALSTDLATSYRGQVKQTYEHALRGFVANMTEADALALSSDPMVAYVEEDGIVTMSATQTGATWGLDRVDQRNRPTDGSYTYANTASNVHAYIVDTGIRITHTDFGGRATSGFSAINDGQGTNDCNGHGTHVAGTVGGATWGLAKGVQLVAVRVLDCAGSGSNSGVIAGVDWVTANAIKPAVANMSLGGGASAALDQAVTRAVDAGIVFAVAAGNETADACGGSPARAPAAITVGSTASSDARSSFSNFGSCVDIMAPGSSIKSTSNGSNTATATLSGTSMASPHVAGAAALYLSANPSASPSAVVNALGSNASAVVTDLRGSPNRLLFTGFIGGGGGDPPPPPPPPPPGGGTPNSGTDTRSVARNAFVHYEALPVLAGSTITVVVTDSSGDADLYVRFGAQATTTAYNCRPYLDAGAPETCSLTVPAGTTQAFVSVRGYTAATYSLTANWVEP